MSMMQTRTFTVRFLTPAFLGDAEQNGRWRTPPFKHLLREWWRVAWVAAGNDPSNWSEMRKVEGKLFGHAWLDPGKGEDTVNAKRSLVRMRLEPWASGRLRSMPQLRPVGNDRNAVASHLYLGYGPVRSSTELKMNQPIDPEKDEATMKLAWPEEEEGAEYILDALALIHGFGTIGGRARNGWGSVCLFEDEQAVELDDFVRFLRPWEECLEQSWAHAIGQDNDGPLVWYTDSSKTWHGVIEQLGVLRKSVNTLAKQNQGRLVVNQPVARRGERVPSNLRFKVYRDEEGYYGTVFHMPFLPPGVNSRDAERVWPVIHTFLDKQLIREAGEV